MKYGYIGLDGVVTDPVKALDGILKDYFYADSIKHGINVDIQSLRKDMQDGSDIASNIKDSLNILLSKYYDVFTCDAANVGKEGKMQNIELTITVTDNGQHTTFNNVLQLNNGGLVAIVAVGHL